MSRLLVAMSLVAVLVGCAHRGVETVPASPGEKERGEASWYGEPYHGRRTASGEVYDMYELTAAHRTLDFGTRVRVTRRDSGASVEVRINDRGPFIRGRIIDLSLAAARRIGLEVDGVAPVEVEVLGVVKPPPNRGPEPEPQADDCLWVQVGAFGDLDNARRARDRLKQAGEKAIVMEGPKGLQRVRVGPFDATTEAERVLSRLRAEWPPAQIVGCGD